MSRPPLTSGLCQCPILRNRQKGTKLAKIHSKRTHAFLKLAQCHGKDGGDVLLN